MNDQSAAGPRGGLLKWALWGVALIGVAAVLYIIALSSSKPEQQGGLKAVARGEMKKLVLPEQASAGPAHAFLDAEGKPVRAADFKGKVLVLNLWATWCAPCVAEMPTLAKLAQAYQGKPVVVAPVSVDSDKDVDKARAFIAKNAPLAFYSDPQMKLPFAFTPPVSGMPTTIIYSVDGRELGRLSGGADWSGPDARAVIDRALAER
jgi:thiol-disulfide isomerase/thioredoxin